MAGIYLHIPFCRQACHYCDFHFSTTLKYKDQLVDSLVQEAELQKEYLGQEEVQTIYFGGGTPSLLNRQELEKLLNVLEENYKLAPEREVTLEANPDDLKPEKLRELKDAGINRLSIGIQSFQDEHLRFMNRAHHAGEALQCVQNAREAGFDNISIDLIYAIPSPDHHIWQKDLATALALRPEHISSYCLTIEPQTAFGNWLKKGKIKPIDEEYAARQFEILLQEMAAAGYEQYEISNFCLPEKHSKHNSSYWQQQSYLGLGPSAHSFNQLSRQYNVANNARYMQALAKKTVPFEKEELGKTNRINEYLLTGLRTKWGCNFAYLRNELGYDMQASQAGLLTELTESGYTKLENDGIILTNSGKLLADEICSRLMLDQDL